MLLIIPALGLLLGCIAYFGIIADQKQAYRMHKKPNETYDQFCNRYFVRYL